MKNNPIIIKRAGKEEKNEIFNFTKLQAFKLYSCEPPPPPQIIFVAYQEHKIIGTMGLNFSQNNKPFYLENHYNFDITKTPFPFEREKIAQYGRWFSIIPNISSSLFYLTTDYAIKKNKIWGLGEMKKTIAERVMKFGVNLFLINDTELIFENIPKEEKQYYLTLPPPSLYMGDLKQIKQALWKIIEPIIQSGEIIFQMEEEL